jgi:hypothetical protein
LAMTTRGGGGAVDLIGCMTSQLPFSCSKVTHFSVPPVVSASSTSDAEARGALFPLVSPAFGSRAQAFDLAITFWKVLSSRNFKRKHVP